MRNPRILAVAALLFFASVPALACGPSLVYFYDEDYTWGGYGDCGAELTPGTPLIVHVLFESFAFPSSLRELEFQVPDWIGNPGEPLGRVTEHWSADQASGSLEEGITLTWEDGLEPFDGWHLQRQYDLGYLEIEAYSPDWVGAGRSVHLSVLEYVDDEGWVYPGDNWDESKFTFNGGSSCLDFVWDPPDSWRSVRHMLPEDGALVAPVFPLRFQVLHVSCEGGLWYPFDGTVSLEGEQIAEFSGDGVQDFAVTVDASAHPPGSQILVEIAVQYPSGYLLEYPLQYTISDVVPTARVNLSALKSLYR